MFSWDRLRSNASSFFIGQGGTIRVILLPRDKHAQGRHCFLKAILSFSQCILGRIVTNISEDSVLSDIIQVSRFREYLARID